MNLYGYANGDPISYSDPYGLCPPISSCLAGNGPKSAIDLASLRKGNRRHFSSPIDIAVTPIRDTMVRGGLNDQGELVIFMQGGVKLESHLLPAGAERIPINFAAVNVDTGEFDVWGSTRFGLVTVSVQGNYKEGTSQSKVCIGWVKCFTESQAARSDKTSDTVKEEP